MGFPILSGAGGGVEATVEATNKALRTTTYPREVTGVYSVRATTGVLAAALAVDAALFGIRNATAATKDIFILRIAAGFSWVVAATAAQQFGIYMERFSVAALAGGAAALTTKHDTTYPASQAAGAGGDVRVSTTAALTVSGVTFDGGKVPLMGWTNPAIGTGLAALETVFDSEEGAPFRLRAGEGLALRNLVVWPAAGTGVLTARVTWEER